MPILLQQTAVVLHAIPIDERVERRKYPSWSLSKSLYLGPKRLRPTVAVSPKSYHMSPSMGAVASSVQSFGQLLLQGRSWAKVGAVPSRCRGGNVQLFLLYFTFFSSGGLDRFKP